MGRGVENGIDEKESLRQTEQRHTNPHPHNQNHHHHHKKNIGVSTILIMMVMMTRMALTPMMYLASSRPGISSTSGSVSCATGNFRTQSRLRPRGP